MYGYQHSFLGCFLTLRNQTNAENTLTVNTDINAAKAAEKPADSVHNNFFFPPSFNLYLSKLQKQRKSSITLHLQSSHPRQWVLWVNRFVQSDSLRFITAISAFYISTALRSHNSVHTYIALMLSVAPKHPPPHPPPLLQTMSASHCATESDQATKYESLTQETETAETVQWLARVALLNRYIQIMSHGIRGEAALA